MSRERRTLGELVGQVRDAASGDRLWVADRWPWTPGMDAMYSERRPRWALADLDLDLVQRVGHLSEEAAVRELNRELDPGVTSSVARRRPS